MPIAVHDDSGTTRLGEEKFKDEAELQACLERSPCLLISESEPPVATVCRELSLPSAGILDLLAVDKEGLPVAVEVKLSRNAQSRREVVAQAFDYLSDLSELDFDELDELVDGALEGAIQELAGPDLLAAVRKQCATNLRAGRIRLVIAVDSAPADLIRIVRYITDHSDIDVRLVCVSKSQFEEKRILVSRTLVAQASEATERVRRVGGVKEADPAFLAIVDAYDRTAEEEWKTRGHAPDKRQIRRDQWPSTLHYQFTSHPNEVGISLDLESVRARGLAKPLSSLAGEKLAPGIVLEWHPTLSGDREFLVAKVGKDQTPEVGARAMQALIARTREIVENYLKT